MALLVGVLVQTLLEAVLVAAIIENVGVDYLVKDSDLP
jgi:hypothetical protein